jgi:hypothetical protein
MKSLFVMMTLGIGEIIGSLVIGQVIDRFRERPKLISHLINISIISQTLMTVYYIAWGSFGFTAHFLALLTGISDSFVNTHIY